MHSAPYIKNFVLFYIKLTSVNTFLFLVYVLSLLSHVFLYVPHFVSVCCCSSVLCFLLVSLVMIIYFNTKFPF